MNEPTPVAYDVDLVKGRFIAAMEQTLRNLSSDDAVYVRSKLIVLLGEWNAHLLGTKDMLTELADKFIFNDEILRSWFMNTRFVFFMNISGGQGRSVANAILLDLAIAMSEDMDAGLFVSAEESTAADDSVCMPPNFLEELPNASQARAIIVANTWLVIVMLIFAFIDLDHPVLKTPVEKK
jgi:hypothetical protein